MLRNANDLSRRFLANPHQNTPLIELLKKNKSVDLRNNRIIIDHENGYDQIKPIDTEKRFQ